MEINVKINNVENNLEIEVEIRHVEICNLVLPWSEAESSWLRQGIEMFGYGNWEAILNRFPFHQNRTKADLRDRAFYMELYRVVPVLV